MKGKLFRTEVESRLFPQHVSNTLLELLKISTSVEVFELHVTEYLRSLKLSLFESIVMFTCHLGDGLKKCL